MITLDDLTKRYFLPPIGSSPIGFGILGAAVFASPCLCYPLYGQVFFLRGSAGRWNNEPLISWVDGNAAIAGALFYLCLGLAIHFSYYWREKPALEKFSPILSNTAMIGCLTLAVVTAFV